MAVDYKALKDGGFMPQKQKDNFSLRVQVVGGYVTGKQLTTIQGVADKYGHGYVHLTSRQSVEIPFIRLDDIEAVKADLAKGGCRPGACGPAVRTITACQGNAVCAGGNIDAYQIAKELDRRYYGKTLSHKFKIGVTGCRNNCLKAEENDLGIKGIMLTDWTPDACVYCGLCDKVCRQKAVSIEKGKAVLVDQEKCNKCGRCAKVCPKKVWKTQTAYELSFGGLFGNAIHKGSNLLPPVTSEEKLYEIADATLNFFAEHGKKDERFRLTLDRVGWDVFEEYINKVSV